MAHSGWIADLAVRLRADGFDEIIKQYVGVGRNMVPILPVLPTRQCGIGVSAAGGARSHTQGVDSAATSTNSVCQCAEPVHIGVAEFESLNYLTLEGVVD